MPSTFTNKAIDFNESDVKRRDTIGCIEQYTTPNSKYTGG